MEVEQTSVTVAVMVVVLTAVSALVAPVAQAGGWGEDRSEPIEEALDDLAGLQVYAFEPIMFDQVRVGGPLASHAPMVQPGPVPGSVTIGSVPTSGPVVHHIVVLGDYIRNSAQKPVPATPHDPAHGPDDLDSLSVNLLQRLQSDLAQQLGQKGVCIVDGHACQLDPQSRDAHRDTKVGTESRASYSSAAPVQDGIDTRTSNPAQGQGEPVTTVSSRSPDKSAALGSTTGTQARISVLEWSLPDDASNVVAAVVVVAAPLLLFALHSRLRSSRILENDNRRRIIESVRESPGLTLRELSDEIESHESTVRYHVGVLEEHGMVRTGGRGRRVSVFPAGQLSKEERQAISLLQSRTASSIVRLVVEDPGVRQADVARSIGRSDATVAFHVARLKRAGLLDVQYFDPPSAKRLVPASEAERLLGMVATQVDSTPKESTAPA